MNDKRFNTALLLGILLTLIAVFAQQFFPLKRFIAWPNPSNTVYFYFSNEVEGQPAAFWIDQEKSIWRCKFPEIAPDQYFACSFNTFFNESLDHGLDLSQYTHLNLKLNYTGSANRTRIYVRNFDPAYSKVEDGNSTKFNAVTLHTRDLKEELHIGLDEFIVGDWWLSAYDIPRELSRPDMRNAITFGIDFVEQLEPGNHDMQIEKVEFVGEWISAEDWYLLILASWMLGIFFYAVMRLIKLQRQSWRDGKVIHLLSDKNARLQLEKDKFRHLSTVDSLTQAYNRFGIDNIIASLINLKTHSGTQQNVPDFALLLIDIDHFKPINDKRGHDTGDRILQNVASIINQNINAQDFLGRWGGEEFLVIMPDTDKDTAFKLAEKIRLVIHETTFEPQDPLSVTISVGVSDRLENEAFASCFKRADDALYAAKAQGRNTVVMAKEELVE